jgi:hypothetical protein
MRLSLPVICALGLGLAGCESLSGHVCTAIALNAMEVRVVDGASNQLICDATVTAVEGSFSEVLVVRPFPAGTECTYSGPTERAGVYEVRVTKAGYAANTTSNVRVSRDDCHVIPVKLTVTLNRTS